MDLRDFLLEVSGTYDRAAPMSSPTQQLLRRASDHLAEHAPAGFLIKGSGGVGNPAFVPWIGIFNPDETSSPQEGIYVVYLFSADLQEIALSLNQGITRLKNQMHSYTRARQQLASDAASIREALPESDLDGLNTTIDLDPTRTAAGRYRENFLTYEAANIVATTYSATGLPAEASLKDDLARFLTLYEEALVVKRNLLVSDPGTIASASPPAQVSNAQDPLLHFKPKDDSEYVTELTGKTLVKTRSHETLITRYGAWAKENGFQIGTPHPRDLVLRNGDKEWLIEGEVVRRGNATAAVRECLGQLFTYRHFLYGPESPVGLVGLFSEPIGEGYVNFLETRCGIASVWWESGEWRGSGLAIADGVGVAPWAH